MEKSWEQAPQSAAASDRLPSIIDEEKTAAAGALRKRNFLRCCSCAGALLFFVVILAGTLIFTVFRVRGPALSLNSFTLVKLEVINGTNLPRRGSNATLNADVSMKNRNFVSFRHPITTSTIYYHGVAIGEVRAPAGNMPARRTTRMNVTADIIMDRVVAQPAFGSDMKSGSVQMSWYTRVGGRAKFFFIKKHVTFKMNCTATVNVTAKALQKYKCKPTFKL
ncbi:hypothetical protein C2S51_022217 [Perilla frutescens var. frutescens]|nr:hypothetical protein C2S51_022217 [Perilla frutescens var. frutescens]